MEHDERVRAARLAEAQRQAEELFLAVGDEGLLRPGVRDREASRAVTELAADRFGVARHWHKRIVRSGPNTLQPYSVDPPDRTMTDDDIVFADFGPIFDGWEADFGRTWVLGDDPIKLRLRDDLALVFADAKAYFADRPAITAAELHAEVIRLTAERGWELGNVHCGHIVGEFPHEKLAGMKTNSKICPENDRPLRALDPSGRIAHWILEIHLVDRAHQIGGFYEELLTI